MGMHPENTTSEIDRNSDANDYLRGGNLADTTKLSTTDRELHRLQRLVGVCIIGAMKMLSSRSGVEYSHIQM